jgi:hypothetical protein
MGHRFDGERSGNTDADENEVSGTWEAGITRRRALQAGADDPYRFRDRLISRLAAVSEAAVRPLCLERPWRNSSRPFEKGGCDGYADSSGAAGQENLTTHLVTSSVRARCRTRCVVRSRSRSEVRVW